MPLPLGRPLENKQAKAQFPHHVHNRFPSQESIFSAGRALQPLIDQDLDWKTIKEQLGNDHAAFDFPMKQLFEGWTGKIRGDTRRRLCKWLVTQWTKWDSQAPTLIGRFPLTERLNSIHSAGFDGSTLHAPLAQDENTEFLQHLVYLISREPGDIQMKASSLQRWFDDHDFYWPVIVEKGQPPIKCRILIHPIDQASLGDFIKHQQAIGNFKSLEIPKHLQSRTYYPPTFAGKKLFDGTWEDCPAELRNRCIEANLHYLLYHGHLPHMVMRELCVLSGVLLPNATEGGDRESVRIVKFLRIFDYHGHSTGMDLDEDTDMYRLKVGQQIPTEKNGSKGSISLNQSGYQYYLDYIATHPSTTAPYSPLKISTELSSNPAFAAIRDVQVRGLNWVRCFHNLGLVKASKSEKDQWIGNEIKRCGHSCAGPCCIWNESVAIKLGLGLTYAAASDSNMFLCLQDWIRDYIAFNSGVSLAEFKKELAIPASEFSFGIKTIGARFGQLTPCIMGCYGRYGNLNNTWTPQKTLGGALLVCGSCSKWTERQYNKLEKEASALLIDHPEWTRKDLPLVKLNVKPRSSTKCSTCNDLFVICWGNEGDDGKFPVGYYDENGEPLCFKCYRGDRLQVWGPSGISDSLLKSTILKLNKSPTLQTLSNILLNARTPTHAIPACFMLATLRGDRAYALAKDVKGLLGKLSHALGALDTVLAQTSGWHYDKPS